jgi:hypothetical protein
VVFLKVEAAVMLVKGTAVLLVLVVLEHMRRSTNAARIETDRPTEYINIKIETESRARDRESRRR